MANQLLILAVIACLQAVVSGKNTIDVKCRGSGGVYPASNKPCSTYYYYCKNGIPHLVECPPLSVFIPGLKKCKFSPACLKTTDKPDDFSTTESTVDDITTEETSISTEDAETGDSTNTTKEITENLDLTTAVTEEETTTNTATETSTVVDTTYETQEYTESTEPTATETEAKTTTKVTTTEPTIPHITTSPTKKPLFVCPSNDGIFTNPDSCFSFYICSNGWAHLFACPATLVYNAALRICDWPYNVPDC